MADCSCHSHGSFLTAKGLQEAAQRERASLEVAGMELTWYLDKARSVSALSRVDQLEFGFPQLKINPPKEVHNGS